MKVKNTYLSAVKLGDIGMHTSKGLFAGDVIGEIIVVGEGNRGRDEDLDGVLEPGRSSGNYTHCFWVTELPDPEADVEVVRINKKTGRTIYRVKDKAKSGKKCHATWPCIKEEPIDWSETHFELWRIRAIAQEYFLLNKTPVQVLNIIKWARERIGRVYNWLEIVTFGLIHLPNSWQCSQFIFDGALTATFFNSLRICLSPDGDYDSLVTPNDLINSGKMIRMRYDGELPKTAEA